ncbi:hypothetical protein OG21DRAFT_1587504 [Imleria badia]|nr:hypothetical protein OG21DRAFT_1587504 [Imleria badia]
MYHVQFSDPTIAFDKPVTEVLILTLKAPENQPALVDIFQDFRSERKDPSSCVRTNTRG